MGGMNKVILMGKMTRDPEIRFTPNGGEVCSFGLAVNRRYKKGEEWQDEVTFIDCAMWGARGKVIKEHFAKGSPILLEGRLTGQEWTDKTTGQKRTKMGVTVENFEFIDGAKKGGGGAEANKTETTDAELPF